MQKAAGGGKDGREKCYQGTTLVSVVCRVHRFGGDGGGGGFYKRLTFTQSRLWNLAYDLRLERLNLAYKQDENTPLVFVKQCAAERGGR